MNPIKRAIHLHRDCCSPFEKKEITKYCTISNGQRITYKQEHIIKALITRLSSTKTLSKRLIYPVFY